MLQVTKGKVINRTKYIDPAPSMFIYRLNRFWLRKSFRLLILIIFPVVLSVLTIFTILEKTSAARLIASQITILKTNLALTPALKITGLNIISENFDLVSKVNAIASYQFPLSSLEIDVESLRFSIEALDAVKTATVRLNSNGLIDIAIEERNPVAVHKLDGHFYLLDKTGIIVDEVFSREDRLDLPLLVGFGASESVEEALRILISAKDLILRVRGLVRIGERRWDIILDRDQVIKLPEEGASQAIKKIIFLQQTKKILDRDIKYLDFRDSNRPIIGLTERSFNQLPTHTRGNL